LARRARQHLPTFDTNVAAPAPAPRHLCREVVMSDAERVRALLDQGLEHHTAGRLADAGEIYLQVLALDGDHADALHLSGVVADQLGQHDLAVQFICEAITRNAGEPVYYHNLGHALLAVGNTVDSERCFAYAIQLNPGYARAWFSAATLRESLGDSDGAAEMRSRALELDPSLAA
jgi:tetratricopeptide (TPR) repeat protein